MEPRGVARWQVVLALGLVWVLWGSTYLAMRFAVETLPPFGMAAARFLVAGAILYGWTRLRGAPAPNLAQWRTAALVGLLLLFAANGAVVWAEQYISSSLAALLVSVVPLFMALLEWVRHGRRPTVPVAIGLVVGFLGVVVLVDPRGIAVGDVAPLPVLLTVAAAFSFAAGSLLSRDGVAPPTPAMGSAMQMLAGGGALLLLSAATGELAAFDPGAATLRSVGALLFLITFGSLIGFTAYVWLLRNVQPALAGTYAYVNPVVAVFLGWALADEAIGPRTLIATVLIVGGVGAITLVKGRTARPQAPAPAAPEEALVARHVRA